MRSPTVEALEDLQLASPWAPSRDEALLRDAVVDDPHGVALPSRNTAAAGTATPSGTCARAVGDGAHAGARAAAPLLPSALRPPPSESRTT